MIPSLYALGARGLLPQPVRILGVARRDWDDESFRREMRPYAKQQKHFHPDTWRQFAQCLHFVRTDFTSSPSEDYAVLREHITMHQTGAHLPDNVLFHFSTPPSVYGEITQKLAAASLPTSDTGWPRVIIEKPFGYDEASARLLDSQLHEVIQHGATQSPRHAFPNYSAGTWGPPAADTLLKRDERRWRVI